MKNLILVALTIVFSNAPAMAGSKSFKDCGARNAYVASRNLRAQAAEYCAKKKLVEERDGEVFDIKPKKSWGVNAYGQYVPVLVSCYEQYFNCR